MHEENHGTTERARFILQFAFFSCFFRNPVYFLFVMTIEFRAKTIRLFSRKYKVNAKTGCHEWHAGLTKCGYGQFRVDGKVMKAHRVSWMLFCGEIPGGMFVCHRCDNPRCVNPDHLFVGSQSDNMADMKVKGRGFVQSGVTWQHARPDDVLRGEDAPSVKISKSAVESIFAENDGSWGIRSRLGRKYGISPQHVGRILDGKAWAHLR